jgi:hypothetical protein
MERLPVTPRLKLVVDALEEGEELAASAKRAARKGTPAGS